LKPTYSVALITIIKTHLMNFPSIHILVVITQAYLLRNFDHNYTLTILKKVYLNILTKNRRSLKTANISLYVDLTKNLVSIRQSLDFSVAGKSASEDNNIRCNLKPTYLAALITIIKTHFMNFLSILTLLVIIQAYLLRNTDHYYNLTILKKVYLNILTKNCQSHKTAHSSLHIDLLDGKHINSNQCRRVMK